MRNEYEIDNLSAEIFRMALRKMEAGANADERKRAAENLKKIKKLSKNVSEENVQYAKKIISECTVEVNYICGKSENMSLRMADHLRYFK